jgi:hypothetical protein
MGPAGTGSPQIVAPAKASPWRPAGPRKRAGRHPATLITLVPPLPK